MNNNTQTNLNAIHLKVSMNDDIRRFAIIEAKFNTLIEKIVMLFSVPTSVLTVKFLDDEGDWVTIASDDELLHAIELSPNRTLRIRCEIPTDVDVDEDVMPFDEDELEWRRRGPVRGRGRGCGRGRGRARGRAGWKKFSREEKMNCKVERLTARIEILERKLQNDSLPRDRARTISWRLEKLKTKRDLMLSFTDEQPSCGSMFGGASAPPFRGRWGGRGRRGGRGRGRGRGGPRKVGLCGGKARRFADPTDLRIPMWEAKDKLIEARNGDNEEEIEAAFEAFKEAKNNMIALRDPEKFEEFKLRQKEMREAKGNLKKARKSGDEQLILFCEEEVKLAVEAFKFAKTQAFQQ